jgi:hypothetical protein
MSQSFPEVDSGKQPGWNRSAIWTAPVKHWRIGNNSDQKRNAAKKKKICSSHVHDDKHPGKSKQEKKDCENDSQEGPAIMGRFANDKASPQKKNDGKY